MSFASRPRDYIKALHETAAGLMSRRSLEELLAMIVKRAGDLADTEHGAIFLVDSTSVVLELRVTSGIYDAIKGLRLEKGKFMAGQIWESGKARVLDNYQLAETRLPDAVATLFRAWMGLPLTIGDETIGVIVLVRTDDRRFTPREVELLGQFADLASIALTNARYYEEILESEERYRTLFDQSSDAVALIDLATRRVIEANQRFKDLLGYDSEELLRLTAYDFVVDERSSIDLYYEKTIPALKYIPLERQHFRRKDGSIIQVERTGALVRYAGHELFMTIVRDVTLRQKAEEKLRYISSHDALTDLYNRSYFENTLCELSRKPGIVGLLACDVDGLKLINDTMGHSMGDELLIAAARVLEWALPTDEYPGRIIARTGGDEFVIIVPGAGSKTMEGVCKKIRQVVDEHNTEASGIQLSLSLGTASGGPGTDDLRSLFKEADNNMYRDKLHRSQSIRSSIVTTIMQVLKARDLITEKHAHRLQELVEALAEEVGFSESGIQEIRLLAQFHDIGKVGISDKILLKPGSLTPEEIIEMRRHCEIGHRIAQAAPDLMHVAEGILKHHEWWNGKGYPLGLKGKDIPLACRILSISDAYDAMTSTRPYRKKMSQAAALAELKRCAGTQFDPELVDRFIRVWQLKGKE